ncbi:IS66 family transposase, partial [Shigella dysenteriae]
LSGWVDACCRLLSPLEEALQDYVLTDGKLHADDTPVPVLLPGNKKTKTGRLWTYVRDDRNAGFNELYRDGRITEAACWAH